MDIRLNLKNKFILQSPDVNLENGGRNTNNYQTKKNNPLTTRIKLDIMTEEHFFICKYVYFYSFV